MFQKIGLDGHAVTGITGFLATISLSGLNTFIACLVGLATLVYMTFRAAREARKWWKGE